jgi:hypothetical protein
LQVLDVWDVYYNIGASSSGYGAIQNHHQTHEWPDTDTVWAQREQIVPLLVLPSAGLIVQVFGGILYNGTEYFVVLNQELDLTSLLPTEGALWALIQTDETGTLSTVVSASVDGKELLTVSNIPAPSMNNYPLAAVRLYDGQEAIQLTEAERDIRMLSWSSGYAVNPKLSGSATQYYGGDGEFHELPTVASFFLSDENSDISGYETLDLTRPLDAKTSASASIPANDTEIEQFIADAGLFDFISGQVLHCHLHLAKTAGTKAATAYVKIFHRTSGGTETLMGTSEETASLAGAETSYDLAVGISDTDFAATDRLVLKIYGNQGGSGTDPTVAVYFEGDTDSRIEAGLALAGGSGTGDMTKAVYDTDDDGVVDDSESTHALLGFPIDPSLSPMDGHVLAWDDYLGMYVDTAGGSSSGAIVGIIEVDFGTTLVYEKTFTVTDANITTDMQVIAQVADETPAGRHADEALAETFDIKCVSGSGQFTMVMACLWGRVSGKFKVSYVAGVRT